MVVIFVKYGLDSEEIKYTQKNDNLEVAKVRIFCKNENFDIVNIYTNGENTIEEKDFSDLLQNLGKNHIIVGDFNARDRLWDDQYQGSNGYGREILKFININNLIVLNSGEGTRFNDQTGNATAIDLTLASSSACQGFEWHIHDSTLESDHFPIITTIQKHYKSVSQTPFQNGIYLKQIGPSFMISRKH